MHDESDRNRLLMIIEHYLVKWLTRRMKETASVSGPQIQGQARTLYAAIARKKNIVSPHFDASVGWLYKFKCKSGTKHTVYQCIRLHAQTAEQNHPSCSG